MAERPIFVPDTTSPGFVREISFEIPWAGGFAPSQKKKNVDSLHQAAKLSGFEPLLEISTKSDVTVGQRLSAFYLKLEIDDNEIPLECAFQGSKVFERGGPFIDLYVADPKSAKRDLRLLQSGKLMSFLFNNHKFPLQPMTVFYDWLYLSAIYPHRDWLASRLIDRVSYAGFTDIEFNPSRSVNCQARSCALFVALVRNGLLEDALESPETFIRVMRQAGRGKLERALQDSMNV